MACEECGNDDPTEGHSFCLDCLEKYGPEGVGCFPPVSSG